MPSFRTNAGVAMGLLLLAGCVPAPKPAPAPAPPPQAPASSPPPPPVADWRDAALTDGTWTYARDGTGSEARFGPAGTAPLFVMRCEPAARRVLLRRSGAVAGEIRVRTTYGAQAWPLGPAGAVLNPADTALDRIAFSRGRFAVEAAGQPALLLPAWAEPSRVIEDCR
jgi:hypothetical protein